MTATGSPRHAGRNWTTGVVYCDEPSDPANPGPLPISIPPSMLQCRMQKRLMRIGTDIVNVEMVTDDGGRIPAQYQDLPYPREIQGLCGRMQQDMPTLAPHLSRHAKGIRKKSDSGSRSVGREQEEMTGYPAVRNHTNCVDLRNLGDGRQVTRSSELHETGPQECLSPHPNQGRRRVRNRVSHPAHSSSTESCCSG